MEKLYPFKLYIKSIPNVIMFGLSALLNTATWFWLFWNIRPQEEPVFLHYNILFGVDYIGPWWKMVFLPATGFVILLTNAVLGWLMYQKHAFFAHLANAASVLCQIFILISASLLVFLNV